MRVATRRAIGIVMSERSASTRAVLVEEAEGVAQAALLGALDHLVVLERRRHHLAVAEALEARRAARASTRAQLRASPRRTSLPPAGRGPAAAGAPRPLRLTHGPARCRAPSVAQALVDALVAAVDLADVADLADALGAPGGDEHRHAGADVGALQRARREAGSDR